MSATIASLKNNGIQVATCDLQDVVLPPHIGAMRGIFLDFHGTIFDLYDLKNDEDPWKLLEHRAWNKAKEEWRSPIKELIERAESAKRHAEEILKKGDEAEWKEFFSERFFGPLRRAFDPSEEKSRNLSRQKYFYDSFSYSAEKNWNLFDKRTGYRVNERRGLWKPKPDTVCYFPIHQTRSPATDSPPTGKYVWRSTAQESLVQNFSLETLDQLNRFGLQYCPLDPFKGQSYSLQKPHCFPWLIAEYKVAAKQTEKCVCQAANAGTAALMLFQTAARFASDKVQGRHVPPVVTITTTSNIIKVWIMYYAPKESDDAYVMDPIWEGDITKVSDCIKFEYILENIHTWATRSLKPLLSSYIDQWRHRFLSGKHKYGNTLDDLHKKITSLKIGTISELLDVEQVLASVADMHFELGRADAASAFEAGRGLDGGDFLSALDSLLAHRLEKFAVAPVAARRTSKAGPDSPPPTERPGQPPGSSKPAKDASAPFVFGLRAKTADPAFETSFADRFAGVQFFADGADTFDPRSTTKRFRGSTKGTDSSTLKSGHFSRSRRGLPARAASAEPLSKPEPPGSDSK